MTTPNGSTPSNPYGDFSESSPQYPNGSQNQDGAQSPDGGQYSSYGSFGAFPQGNEDPAMAPQYAGLGIRFLSQLVDGLISMVIMAICFAAIGLKPFMDWMDKLALAQEIEDRTGIQQQIPELSLTPFYIAGILSTLIWFAYRVFMEHQWGGSLGRMATSTRVQDQASGTNPSLRSSAIRNSWILGAMVIGWIPLVGTWLVFAVYIAIAVTISKSTAGQSFTDQWARTQVVRK
ncbi:RDD family protein [Corynebacterium sp. 319]|uniref:RDD family protein n=1 Tax=unclassified Corynebacterium TaxID=2624378 RepID=UPI00125CCBB7|nr:MULTISPECIES: RDD family protein [unclassified Corynebacterium]KAB1552788.1 RDD family protein [Corynebacterium sp. 321]KAB1553994.1 RDD family protein [Corynebacterium sp. 319]KAB3540263.1 RDD family protein [Corynebacterium sp. 366]